MMNVSDIIRKTVLDQAEMQFVVEQYIEERKGVKVTIDLTPKSQLASLLVQDQLIKLHAAYDCAVRWFNQQSYKQSLKPIS